jgi:16S rRNA (guanine527-N7)-methyltransferase
VSIGTRRRLLIDDLAARFRLPAESAARLETLAALLSEDPLAPTSVRDPIQVVDEHLADSLVALDLPAVRSARAIADIGAGAGVPGVPLSIALPDADVALVESNARKCAFIARVIETLPAGNARVVNDRAESWTDGRGRVDVVTARALAPLDVVAEYAAPLLRLGGSLVAWRGRRDADVERAASRAAAALGLEVETPLHVVPFRGATHRHLHVMVKVSETPARFPRRPGVARKRPLGSA